ncbi:phosphoglucosamine mutase [Candidatus Nitrososphaera sp. FF02]|uniref:phosphoglucosamine mutase n=1 Tax=Candidatus Nitrososphaera sp. FF02 TaxID=3398226 RepID=UPI0039E7E58F
MQRARLFGTNGVRGVWGRELTSDLVIDLSYAIATYYGKGPIVVGYDGRKSSPVVSRLVRSTLNSAGLDVADAGLVPTPCLQHAAKRLGYNGGIMITASHNPPEYNGIKPAASDGVEIPREDELKVEDIFYSKKFATTSGNGQQYADDTVVPKYIERVLALVNAEKIRKKDFTVAMDTGNGAQAAVAPVIAKALGCKVLVINGAIDGDFPGRGSEPTPDNLGVLAETVRNGKADFGVAFDGDGDRSIFCDDNGQIYWGDKTGSLLAKNLLAARHRGAEIVCPVNTSMVLDKVAEQAGLKVVHTKVGSVEVSREMVKRKAPLGLEENGGFMYGPMNEVRDGAMTTALVLDMLAETSKSFSQLVEELPRTFQHKTKFSCSSREVVERVVRACMDHGSPKRIETMDGAKIWIDDETWLMVRPSGTEPLIRVYAESTDRALLESKVEEYSRIVRSKMAH